MARDRRFEGLGWAAGISLVTLLSSAVFVGGCGGAPAASNEPSLPENRAEPVEAGQADAEPPLDATDTEALAIALKVLDELARVSVGAQGQCGIAAQRIAGIVTSSELVWQRLNEMSRDPAREVTLLEAQVRIDEHMQRFVRALGPCARDERVFMSVQGMTFAQ